MIKDFDLLLSQRLDSNKRWLMVQGEGICLDIGLDKEQLTELLFGLSFVKCKGEDLLDA